MFLLRFFLWFLLLRGIAKRFESLHAYVLSKFMPSQFMDLTFWPRVVSPIYIKKKVKLLASVSVSELQHLPVGNFTDWLEDCHKPPMIVFIILLSLSFDWSPSNFIFGYLVKWVFASAHSVKQCIHTDYRDSWLKGKKKQKKSAYGVQFHYILLILHIG